MVGVQPSSFAGDGLEEPTGGSSSGEERPVHGRCRYSLLKQPEPDLKHSNGEPVDLEDLVRVTNALIRVRTELGKRAKPADEGFDWVQLQEEAARMIREEDAQRRRGANDVPQRSETA